ncbi:hypothetical protein ASZ90_000154 [hydrocarbon metagenome]|uniref:Uncharacterized protein n=1 Tax=hydrocarbon metagenome TaxID=938273 RepID=A0A0W8GA15_9ZZZZ
MTPPRTGRGIDTGSEEASGWYRVGSLTPYRSTPGIMDTRIRRGNRTEDP